MINKNAPKNIKRTESIQSFRFSWENIYTKQKNVIFHELTTNKTTM